MYTMSQHEIPWILAHIIFAHSCSEEIGVSKLMIIYVFGFYDLHRLCLEPEEGKREGKALANLAVAVHVKTIVMMSGHRLKSDHMNISSITIVQVCKFFSFMSLCSGRM